MNHTLHTPIDAIVFDCDGTLSKLEGINELARMNHVEKEVEELTEKAMSEGLFGEEVYERRLALAQPTIAQLEKLGHDYYTHRSDDIDQVIHCFNLLNKKIFIVTAGLTPAIKIFAERLGIPKENIFSVDIHFNSQGHYTNFDRNSPLITIEGKYAIVEKLKRDYPHIVHIGDGLNDYASFELVTRFIGYGGNFYREQMARLCEFYLRKSSTLALLPLCLTEEEAARLTGRSKAAYDEGLALLR